MADRLIISVDGDGNVVRTFEDYTPDELAELERQRAEAHAEHERRLLTRERVDRAREYLRTTDARALIRAARDATTAAALRQHVIELTRLTVALAALVADNEFDISEGE